VSKLPHWTILCIALGAFLLPITGGHFSIESGRILSTDSLILSVLGGAESPFLAHFIISLLFFVPICATLFAKKISHVVNLRITLWLALLGACIGVSIIVSSFPSVTVGVILEWAMMSLAFFSVTLCCGRKQSNIPILSFLTGATIVAILGIIEFGQERAFDPGYRIFAMQVGPNQAGALFASGTILALAMSLRFDRIPRLVLALSAFVLSLALVLTQSKGAIVCLPLGVAVLIVGLLILRPTKPALILGGIIVPFVLTGGFIIGMQKSSKTASGTQAMSRVISSSSESAQSAGFRKLLWSSAIDLVKQKPYGWGMGTFWFESTRPGKVTQTTLAHETFLQLASEASPIAAISLIAFLGSVIVWGLRGIKTQAADNQILLVGILGTLTVAVAHNFVDSDMYIFGLGSMIFLLCGAFVASSSDSQAPEFIFALPKVAFGATAVLLIPLCVSVGFSELDRAIARGAIGERDQATVTSATNSAIAINFVDGQAYSQRALVTHDEQDLINATKLHPSPKTFRALSDFYAAKKMFSESFTALKKALERDPNNAPALLKYTEEAFLAGDDELGVSKAKQLIETENTTYFSVRSQPEYIPTQTYVARLYLVKFAKNSAEKVKLLTEAIKGLVEYRKTTGPLVKRNLLALPTGNFGGEDHDTLVTNYKIALEACAQLIQLQGRVPTKLDFNLPLESAEFTKELAELNK
jgi:hypothetical protein